MAREREPQDEEEDEVVEEEKRGSLGVGTFLAGLAIGAGLALLFAPQSGDELRRKIRRTAKRAQAAAGDMAEDAKHRAQDLAQTVKTRAEEAVEDARHEIAHRVGDARHAIDRRKRDIARAVDAGRTAARDARESFERRIAETRAEDAES